MSDFADFSIAVRKGRTHYFDFAVKKPDQTAQNIAGWNLWFTAKRSLADTDGDAVIAKTTGGGGIVITDAFAGTGYVVLEDTDTNGLPERRLNLFAELTGQDTAGAAVPLKAGLLTILPVVLAASI
jgi:hypothetical protein